jgi:hypothetical protein
MQWIKRLLIAVGAVALVAVITSLVAPKSLRAAVSALVTITNDATNPVLTAITNTSANPVAVNFPSHLGVPPSKFVSLNCAAFSTSNYTSGGSFTVDSAPLRILHLVDQCSDWFLNNVGGTGQDGYSVPSGYDLIITDIEVVSSSASGNGLSLKVTTGAGSGQSSVLQDVGAYDGNGNTVFREHLITGFSCTALPNLILDESQVGGLTYPTNSASFDIQGYLVPAS